MIRIKFNYSKNTEPVPKSNQKYINQYIHNCLGFKNKYHNTHSDYNITSLLGGTHLNEIVDFPNGGSIVISTNNMDFLNNMVTGIMTNPYLGWGMNLVDYKFIDEYCYDGFNNVYTLTPILLKENLGINKYEYVTIEDDKFEEMLTQRTKNKLFKYAEKNKIKLDLTNFKIKVNNENNKSKIKKVQVKNVLNIASHTVLSITCNKDTMELIYCLGIGQSTGSGFGCVCNIENIDRYKNYK